MQADQTKSAEYVKKACELHDATSCGVQHLAKTIDLTATMPARINAGLRHECAAGKMTSCERFGRNLIDGVGVPKDAVTGAEYLTKACSGGVTAACRPGTR